MAAANINLDNILNTWWALSLFILAIIAIFLLISIVFYKPFMKSIFDLVLSALALPFFIFLAIPIAIAIKLDDRGPVFYCGKRLGKNGRVFKMFKFRSMKVNAPDIRLKDGSTYNGDDDDRVTRIGKILRKTSLDEIPQILNILLGQMSFVGPRPDPADAIDKYENEEKKRLIVRPGVTGYNQAYFRNSIEWKARICNDLYYVQHVSLFFDLRIFVKTVFSVLGHRSINVVASDNICNTGSEDCQNSEKPTHTEHSECSSETQNNDLNDKSEVMDKTDKNRRDYDHN